jgi:hypothetical protein
MTVRTLVWRGLDEPRMEIVYAESFDRAHGTQIGVSYDEDGFVVLYQGYLERVG